MPGVYLMIGLPGSGKSTYAKYLSNIIVNCTVHSSDQIRQELFGDESDQSNNRLVFNTLYSRMFSDLKLGKNIIFDATNISLKDRSLFFSALNETGISAEKIAIVIDTDLELCKKNNLKRERQVPEEVYEKMLSRYCPPSFDEGFDRIINVKLAELPSAPSAS